VGFRPRPSASGRLTPKSSVQPLCQATPCYVGPAAMLPRATEVVDDVAKAPRQLTQRRAPYQSVFPHDAELLSHFRKLIRQGSICKKCLLKGPKCNNNSSTAGLPRCCSSMCVLCPCALVKHAHARKHSTPHLPHTHACSAINGPACNQ
jgi:hypothetical protein